MARLRDLDARFLRLLDPDGSSHLCEGVELSDADGVMFLCPLCFKANGGSVGTHSVICWRVGRVGDRVVPGPGRWNFAGTGLDDLTFVPPGAVSVLLTSGCGWHGFVRDGGAE